MLATLLIKYFGLWSSSFLLEITKYICPSGQIHLHYRCPEVSGVKTKWLHQGGVELLWGFPLVT